MPRRIGRIDEALVEHALHWDVEMLEWSAAPPKSPRMRGSATRNTYSPLCCDAYCAGWRFAASALIKLEPRFHNWPRGVTVSTLDSESSDRGSNPREAFFWISGMPEQGTCC